MRRIVLHIDRLILRGVDYSDRETVGRGLEQGLQRLLLSNGAVDALIGQDGATRLKPGRIQVGNGAGPHALGVQAARGVMRSVRP